MSVLPERLREIKHNQLTTGIAMALTVIAEMQTIDSVTPEAKAHAANLWGALCDLRLMLKIRVDTTKENPLDACPT